MNVIYMKHDGRCRWLEKKVLEGIFPSMVAEKNDPGQKKKFLIIDWVSNDNGKVGLDLSWLEKIGVPTVESFSDLPEGNGFAVVNTGYDSIVEEERLLRERGVEIIDMPCPYVRKLRKLLENADPSCQYLLLCEPNHIIIKNFKALFPEDMVLIQMSSYKEKIERERNGKPFRLIPYVTFLPKQIQEIENYLKHTYPDRTCSVFDTCCMWIKSPLSPIREIQNLPSETVNQIDCAVLVSSPGSINKSLVSLIDTLKEKGFPVEIVSSLSEFRHFETSHKDDTILLVRSPIPNEAEKPIMEYLKCA